MKRLFALLLAVVLVLGLSACSNSATTTTEATTAPDGAAATATATAPVTQAGPAFNAETVVSQLTTTDIIINGEYSHYYVAKVKNNSTFTIDIDGRASFFDDAGNLIGSTSDEIEAVPAGQEIVLVYSNEDAFARAEQQLTVSETTYYEPVMQNLVIENQNIAGDKVVFSIKNNGDKPVEFAQITALFFQGETPVDVDYTYATDADYLQPGQSTTAEISSWGSPFDNVQLYVSGRHTKG